MHRCAQSCQQREHRWRFECSLRQMAPSTIPSSTSSSVHPSASRAARRARASSHPSPVARAPTSFAKMAASRSLSVVVAG
jgi:hypothetical protein